MKNFIFGILAASSALSLFAVVDEEAASLIRGSETGRQMLSHVENITVIDSIAVDSLSFIKAFRLSPSAGSLLDTDGLKSLNSQAGDGLRGFTNEFKDYMIWSQPDTTGVARLLESVKLIDDNWSKPMEADLPFEADYPFMLDDGQTLYFASENPESLGGLDIFFVTKDPSDGEYLQPRNIGMPFNSPYNDFMMAVDRENGVGWWITDRNHIPGLLTVYVYLLPDSRENIDPENENLMELALLSDYKLTQEDKDETPVKEALSAIKNTAPKKAPNQGFFSFPMGKGVVYTQFSDFKNHQSRQVMEKYIETEEELKEDTAELKKLRAQYFKGGKSDKLKQQISELEEIVAEGREQLRTLKSEIYRLEQEK